MKTLLRVVAWVAGIGALALSYGLFDLPGLLIGLFVGVGILSAGLWRAAQRRRNSMSTLEVDGGRIDFATMILTLGEETYSLRRSEGGKWERHATSIPAMDAVVARRKERISKEDHIASLEKAKVLLLEQVNGDPEAKIGASQLSAVMRSLPPWSEGRKATREQLEKQLWDAVKGGSTTLSEADVERALKLEGQTEVLEAIEDWMKDNDGFESLPIFAAPVETAYQRYIHQG